MGYTKGWASIWTRTENQKPNLVGNGESGTERNNSFLIVIGSGSGSNLVIQVSTLCKDVFSSGPWRTKMKTKKPGTNLVGNGELKTGPNTLVSVPIFPGSIQFHGLNAYPIPNLG